MQKGKIVAQGCVTRFRLPAKHLLRHILIQWK